ncbi:MULTISPECIES: heavy metal sensor histidine kinase [unclassified Simplicispira]|uniref:heavy metal sensor histidine kinase n=1 Tax=unclassified Simplicispira TaxID=2630407 RepID=UPI000D5D10FB|nr:MULTISPECIES: heavy metal sensor histidine kinase [unclassified Simplicispira]PVY57433.1 two-component system heavy metal sensor histidine kinase CusS [Simplicispira sp. 125]REG18377.1 two-component system heavy metal sensor histidine kinase CusS [Simplicispira sp. 110]
MKALVQHRSLRQRLSWWLALQSFAGLGLVCLAVYLVTEFNFRDRQEETLAQKENVIRHLLADGKEHGDSEDLAHKLDDFLVGHGDLSLEVAQADGAVLYAHTRNQNEKTVWRQRQFEVAQSAGQTPSKSLRVQLSLDIQTDNQLLHRLAVTLLVAAIGGAVVVSLGGFSLVNLGLAPVRRLASQTRAVSADNLHQRLDGAEQPLELVPLIDQFNALLARIEKAYSQMEGFNADVAHELCTPLATLIANNELALRRPEQADIREVLASNLEELHRLTGIVNDMLFLSQADRGVGARRVPVASLASVAADVLDYHEAALAEAGLTAKVVGDAHGTFDVPLLRRALSNLLGNATRYASTGSIVQINLRTVDEDRVLISVTNYGNTIDPEILPQLFDRFFRADPARSHGQSNHGLGLAIVGAIARMHQGKPVARSENGVTSVGIEIRAH